MIGASRRTARIEGSTLQLLMEEDDIVQDPQHLPLSPLLGGGFPLALRKNQGFNPQTP